MKSRSLFGDARTDEGEVVCAGHPTLLIPSKAVTGAATVLTGTAGRSLECKIPASSAPQKWLWVIGRDSFSRYGENRSDLLLVLSESICSLCLPTRPPDRANIPYLLWI